MSSSVVFMAFGESKVIIRCLANFNVVSMALTLVIFIFTCTVIIKKEAEMDMIVPLSVKDCTQLLVFQS